MSPSCRLFTQYACTFVFIRLAAQGTEMLAQLYTCKHTAPRKRKMGAICSKRVVRRMLGAMYFLCRSVIYICPIISSFDKCSYSARHSLMLRFIKILFIRLNFEKVCLANYYQRYKLSYPCRAYVYIRMHNVAGEHSG